MEKGAYVKDIKPGEIISGIFAVQNASLGTTKKGDPYWTLKLADATGQIAAKIWQPLSRQLERLDGGELIWISARSEEYKGEPQLSVLEYQQLGTDQISQLDASEFVPAGKSDSEALFVRLRAVCEAEFRHPAWRSLVFGILDDPEISGKFRVFPAAKKMHHAYSGGLLEHTLNVMSLCQHFCDRYPQLDRQTLLAGALLHDIGKTVELTGGVANDYTQAGKLLGHTFLGLELLMPRFAAAGLEQPLQEHLKHLILSHHGLPEFGAAKEPATAEAFALHYADNLDAKMSQCAEAFGIQTTGPWWSGWQQGLNRQLLLPEHTPPSGDVDKGPYDPWEKQEDVVWEEETVVFDESLDIDGDYIAEALLARQTPEKRVRKSQARLKPVNRPQAQESQCLLLSKD